MSKVTGGWVPIPRLVRQQSLWSTGERFAVGQAVVDLKLRAAYRPYQVLRGNQSVTVQPGQVLTTMVGLAEDWGWDRETVAAKLSLFASLGLIDVKTRRGAGSGYTLITIKDLDSFPLVSSEASGICPRIETGIESSNAPGGSIGIGPTFAPHSRRNPKRTGTPSKPQGPGDQGEPAQPTPALESFMMFWSLYPKKQDRRAAEKLWTTLAREDGLVEAIVAALQRQKAWATWRRDGGRYVPKPTTWLRGRRWEDEQAESERDSHETDPRRTNSAWEGQTTGEIKL